MGYFLDIAIVDCGIENVESLAQNGQLYWRLEDLKNRLELLFSDASLCSGDERYAATELQYISPCDICTISNGVRAIQLAENELQE